MALEKAVFLYIEEFLKKTQHTKKYSLQYQKKNRDMQYEYVFGRGWSAIEIEF